VSDPRSGEILNSNIGFYHNITKLVEAWYFTQAGAADPRARTLPLPDSLMGLMVALVAAHEVGHTLGLRHNMVASAYYPTDSLRSRSFTCSRQNTSPSIMDYARYNYVAQPGDNACLMQGFGAYDTYAITWGYRRIPGATTPDAERPALDSIARLQDSNPELRWIGDGDPVDPRIATEALGDDPVKATRYGLENIKRIVPMLLPATTTERLEDYSALNDMYGSLIGQWAREMGHVAVVVGGVNQYTKYPTQDGVQYVNVPRDKQAEAVRFLNQNAFTTPTYFLDLNILRRVEPTGSVERIRRSQTALLNTLLADARLSRLVEQSATQGTAQSYTIGDLLGDLHRGIFSETAAARPVVDAYRRNLQRAFVDQMDRLINTPLVPQLPPGLPPQFAATIVPRPADARALARAELRDLDGQLRAAGARAGDRDTKAHFDDLRARIDRVLNPLPTAAGR
ncbi:MAG: zinc-dependent metalloprotease, partial [Gemmatimonadales bacterium]